MSARAPWPLRPRAGFVLLEVILALTIMGLAVSAALRSFVLSLDAARKMEIQTQAIFFAEQLMEYFEIIPPTAGVHVGGFGDDYRNYSYRVEVRYVEPRYRDVIVPRTIEQLFRGREYTLEILYDDGRMRRPYVALRLESAIIGFEKFSYPSKLSYANF